ncbi:MAG: hypothetical protein ACLRS8_04935 [Parabacteroides merdae]
MVLPDRDPLKTRPSLFSLRLNSGGRWLYAASVRREIIGFTDVDRVAGFSAQRVEGAPLPRLWLLL